jgi:hypothetical protein
MPQARVFVPLSTLESWLSEGRAQLVGEALSMGGQSFAIAGAVRFVAEVAGGGDELSLVGRVKSHEQLLEMEAEHAGDSVILGDNAYQVAEGYVLAPKDHGPVSSYPRIVQLFAGP